MNGLVNVNANTGTFTDLEVNNLTVNQSGTAPTMPFADNSTHIATTAFVQGHASGNYVDLTNTQTITGQKTFANANTFITGNLVCNSLQADNSANNINIGTQLYTGDINMGTTASAGQNVALNWGSSQNSGQLSFRGGSFNFNSFGVFSMNSGGTFDTNISNNQTSGILNIGNNASRNISSSINIGSSSSPATTNIGGGIINVNAGSNININSSATAGNYNIGTSGSTTGNINLGTAQTTGHINIGTNATRTTGTINIGRVGTTTNIPSIKGQYIDLFAGQFRMFSASGGGSSIYTYVPPSGRTIVDYSSTNCDMVGQVNLTSNNITCSVAPTTGSEYCNKTYVDSVASSGTALLSSNNLWTGTNEFDNTVTNNMFVNNLDVVSFQNGAYFDNVCPYSTVAPSGAQDLVQKQYVDNSFVSLNGTQTITGAKLFNNFAVSQTSGTDISMSINTVSSDNMYFNFGTSQSLRMHYVNALNRLNIHGTSATREVAIGANGNSYVIINPSTSTLTLNAPTTSVGGGLTMQAGANFTFIPVGTINTSVVATVPTGFLLCNGQAVLRSVYVNLFSAIGTTFGAGDGVNTFNVPDFEGAFLRGAGSQTVGGVTYTAPAIGTAQQDQVLSANYATNQGFRDCAGGTRDCVARSRITGDPVDTNTGILAQFPRQGTENRPMNYSVYYYIKF
jgi:hypothetical protein